MKKYIIPALVTTVIIIAAIIFFGNNKTTAPSVTSSDQPSDSQNTEQIAPNTILMFADRYKPANLTVKKGDKVTFINRDSDDHWPASDNHPSHQIYSQFDPKRPIGEKDTWEFTFDRAGEWKYHDHLFPSIEGSITVNP